MSHSCRVRGIRPNSGNAATTWSSPGKGKTFVWWPIRNQIFLPFAGVLLAAVATIAVFAAYVSAERSEQQTVAQLNRVIVTLGQSSFPYSERVLLQMRGLSGAEFVVLDERQTIRAATLPIQGAMGLTDTSSAVDGTLSSLGQYPTMIVSGVRYFAARVERRQATGTTTLVVLYPEVDWQQARRDAAGPTLVVGLAMIVVIGLLSAWLANRLGNRIRSVQQQVTAVAAGNFDAIVVDRRNDEIHELAIAVNSMSAELQSMQQTIRQSERSRLWGQLAGGLAHQFRNAITGARMAVQIHRRRCRSDANDESLDVALRQLSLTEEQVKGFLSLGRVESPQHQPWALSRLVDEIASLVRPVCEHANVEFEQKIKGDGNAVVSDSENVRTAVLNLTLNAIEATSAVDGEQGGAARERRVILTAEVGDGCVEFRVVDTGPGPPIELADRLLEPFVTGKPEGVGLGLALAKRVADLHDGSLEWSREGGQTMFRLRIRES